MDSEEESFEFNTKTNFEGEQVKIQEEKKISQNYNVLKQNTKDFYKELSNSCPFAHDITWSTYKETEPISVTFNSNENEVGIFDIIPPSEDSNSDCNTLFRKIAITLSTLYSEIENTLNDSSTLNYYSSLYPLAMYNETIDSELDRQERISQEQSAEQMSRMIVYLKETYDKVIFLLNVGINLLCQLIHVYSSNQRINRIYDSLYKEINFDKAFDYLSLILSYFNAIDCIVESKEEVCLHWDAYRKVFLACKKDMCTYNMNEEQKNKLEKNINRISACLLDKSCFSQCVTNLLKHSGEFSPSMTGHNRVFENPSFIKKLINYLKRKFNFLSENLNCLTENKEKHQLFRAISLLAFYFRIMENTNEANNQKGKIAYDKDIIKIGWKIIEKESQVNLVGKVNIDLCSFLKKLNPYSSSSYAKKDIIRKYEKRMFNLSSNLSEVINNLKIYAITWLSRMESDFSVKSKNQNEDLFSNINDDSDKIISLISKNVSKVKNIFQGLIISNYIRLSISSVLYYHVNSDTPTSKQLLFSIIKGLEIIKVIKNQFKRVLPKISAQIDLYNKCLFYNIQKKLIVILNELSKKVKSKKKHKEEFCNLYEAVFILLKNIMCTPSKLRRMVLDTCGSMLEYYDSKIYEETLNVLTNIEILNELPRYINSACDCSFMCWYTEMIPIQVEYLFEEKSNKIINYAASLRDIEEPLKHLIYKEDKGEYIIKENRRVIYSIFEDKFLIPLFNEIEKDLKQQVHATLIDKLDSTPPTLVNLRNLLKIEKFKLFDKTIDIKRYIETKFNSQFYLLTTINPNDWTTYQKIKLYGKSKYDLNFHEIYIPRMSEKQGKDIITIIQKLPNFVEQYSVDLLSQTFIQKVGKNFESNNINLIKKNQILSSLYTNGTGIVNSMVNSVFQYVKFQIKKIVSLLGDDEIVSKLKDELNYWKKNKEKINFKYPYERAYDVKIKLKEIFGENKKQSFIVNVTHIGNAVALVHLIRTALRDYNSANSKLINCDILSEFGELSNIIDLDDNDIDQNSKQNIFNSFKDSTQMFLETMSSFQQTGLNNINYLLLLVDSFKSAFNSDKFKNLDLFIFLFTAACIKHIEKVIVAKKAVSMITNKASTKTIQDEAYFYNDGFIIGMSYILKIFKIDNLFQSLNWFNSVIEYFTNKKEEYEQNNNKYDNTVNLNLQGYQSHAYLTEFNTCLYTYTSASLLFTD